MTPSTPSTPSIPLNRSKPSHSHQIFRNWCSLNSKLDTSTLEKFREQFDDMFRDHFFLKNGRGMSPTDTLCERLNPSVFDWLCQYFPEELVTPDSNHNYPLIHYFSSSKLDYELFIRVINYITEHANINLLSNSVSMGCLNGILTLSKLCSNKMFTSKMLEYLYQINDDFDINIKLANGSSLFDLILSRFEFFESKSDALAMEINPIMDVINKCSKTKLIHTGKLPIRTLNNFAQICLEMNLNPSPIAKLIESCGEYYQQINTKYSTSELLIRYGESDYYRKQFD